MNVIDTHLTKYTSSLPEKTAKLIAVRTSNFTSSRLATGGLVAERKKTELAE